MSQSNAAAIRRRTNIQAPNPATPNANMSQSQPPQQQGQGAAPAGGLTLPQVIAVVDKRLLNLETFMRETKEFNEKQQSSMQSPSSASSSTSPGEDIPYVSEVELNTVIDEFNNRFEILATEINELKDVLLKLQGYTMDVNKMLLNERIQIFSDIGDGKDVSTTDADLKIEGSNPILDNYDKNTKSSVDLRDLAIKELTDADNEVSFST